MPSDSRSKMSFRIFERHKRTIRASCSLVRTRSSRSRNPVQGLLIGRRLDAQHSISISNSVHQFPSRHLECCSPPGSLRSRTDAAGPAFALRAFSFGTLAWGFARSLERDSRLVQNRRSARLKDLRNTTLPRRMRSRREEPERPKKKCGTALPSREHPEPTRRCSRRPATSSNRPRRLA